MRFHKRRILLLLIVFLFGIIIFNPIKKSTSKIDLLAFFDNTTYEEKPLSDGVNTMFVTMIDNNNKVVATTNPEIEVDSDYAFSSEQTPTKQANINDTYRILFELVDTNDENGYAKVEEGIIYTLELPNYLNPQEVFEEPITRKCTDFIKKGKSVACGGIYKENSKYYFKVKFNDVLNKKDVKANYQFPIKLDEEIEDIMFDIKPIDFGLPGVLQLYMKKNEVIDPTNDKNYELKIESNGWTSSTKNYAKWTVTVTDKHIDGYRINGSLYIDFGPSMAMAVDLNNFYTYMNAYADNVKLGGFRGNFEYFYKYSNQESKDGCVKVTPMDLDSSVTSTSYSWSASKFKIDIANILDEVVQNENIEGTHEWKFEFITKEYSDLPTTFNAQVRLVDNNDTETDYNSSASISNIDNDENPEVSIFPKNSNDYSIPETLTTKVNIKNTSNILKIKSIPDTINTTGLYYYLDNLGFTSMNNKLSNTIRIKINNRDVEFTKNGWSPSSLVNGQVSKSDPALYKLLENNNLFNGHPSTSNVGYFRSNITNDDGDFYWLVLEKNTAEKVENLYNGIFDYIDIKTNEMPYPAEWGLFLVNAKGSNVELSWDRNLIYYDRVGEQVKNYTNAYSDRPLNNTYIGTIREKVCINSNCNNQDYFVNALYTPLRIKGEILNDNFIKWEMKIDTRFMNIDLNKIDNNYSDLNKLLVNMKIPNDQLVDSDYFYDYSTNKIVEATTDNSIGTGKISYCIEGNYNNDSSNYDSFECTKYEESSVLSINSNDYGSVTGYPSLMYLDRLDRINDSISSKRYYSISTPKSINALPTNQKGEIRLVFFTKDNNIGTEEKNIYVDVIASNTRKSYGRTQNNHDLPIPIFSVTNKATIRKTETSKQHNNTMVKDGKFVSSWIFSTNNHNNISNYSNVFEEKRLSISNRSDGYNGVYQFSDKFASDTPTKEAIAKNSKLNSISVENTNNYTKYYPNINEDSYEISNSQNTNINMDLASVIPDEKGYYKVCHSLVRQYCVKVRYNYGSDCPTYDKNSQDCTKYENMESGFSVEIEGFNKSDGFDISYETETDLEIAMQEVGTSNFEERTLEIDNNIDEYTWNGISSKPTISKKANISILADIAIVKNISQSNDINYKNDTKSNEVITSIGYTPSRYVEITDFIDGISNLKYNAETNKYDKDDLTTNMSDLEEIRKYVDISNLKISIKDHYKDNYVDIYSNGSFSSDYSESTLTYLYNSNKLYSLHLEKVDGEIPALSDIRITYDLVFNPDKDDNYRLKDIYEGGKLYISTNAEGVRTFENISGNSTEPDNSGNNTYSNKIDNINKTLTVYASSEAAKIGSDYLEPPTIIKNELEKLIPDGHSSWELTYNVNSIGKQENASMKLEDSLGFEVEGDSTYNNNIISVLKEYVKYKNIKIYYNGKNTSTNNNPIYTYNGVLDNDQTISINGITGTLSGNDNSYTLNLSSFNYGDIIIVTYDIDLDFESAYKEMISRNYIDEGYKIKDTHELLKFSYRNRAYSPLYQESIIESSKNAISVYDIIPSIHKQNKGTTNDETSWEISFNTGTSSDDIKVVDKLDVSSDNEELKEIIENSLTLYDLEIKIGDEIIYTNNSFIGEWSSNINILNTTLGFEFNFTNTTNNKFIENNEKVTITYKSRIDDNKYNGKKSGYFSLNNKATITKDGYSSEDEAVAGGINYDFPANVNKEFIGNNTDLTETNWKISVDSGRIKRHNLLISDTSVLGTEFGEYLSISKLKVILNNEIIYDSDNNISSNLFELTDKDGNSLLLNKNGTYEFNLLFSELSSYSNVVIEYTLKIDKDEYISHDEILDNELLINNKVRLTSDDDTDIESSDNGSSKVISKLTKQFKFMGYDSNNNPIVRWYIDVNLKDHYSIEELTDKEVIITDELSDILELVTESLKINERTVVSNGVNIGSLISNDKYELNTENNAIRVKILDPVNTNNIRITFDTICLASISELENSVTLQIGDEKDEIKVEKNIRIFSPIVSGVVTSREVLDYRINAKKYLDNSLSTKEFSFSIIEVDENGNEIENGFKTINTNSNDGTITFNAIRFEDEGFHYYKVKEIKDDDPNIIYDETEYIIKIKTIDNNGSIIVDNIELIDTNANEIVFNNKTKSQKDNNILINPNTSERLLFVLFIIVCLRIGIYFLRKTSFK